MQVRSIFAGAIVVVAVGAIGTAVWQRQLLKEAQAEQLSAREALAAAQAAAPVAPTNAPPPSDAEAQSLELARLRNEVTQLRRAWLDLSNELNRLRAESARLRTGAAEAERQQQGGSLALDPGQGVGGARLGMPAEQLIKRLGEPTSMTEYDRNGRTALFYSSLGMSVICDSNATVVGVMCGTNFVGKTKDGLGIGSSRTDIVGTLGNPANVEQYADGTTLYSYPERGIRLNTSPDEKVQHITITAPR